jgi:serine/threonine protein kinase/tetratricopeptide (TPR) repeat protein
MKSVPPGDASSSPSLAARLDQLSDRFEDAWQAGQRPAIDAFLQEVPAAERPALLRELLRLEIHYRGLAGEAVSQDEYRRRFPGHQDLVTAVFEPCAARAANERDTTALSAAVIDSMGPSGVSTAAATQDRPLPSLGYSGPAGRFRVLRTHAKGGLGEVFVALDQELHREVALKEIQDRHADQPESRARFLREAEVTGGLEHPGIVPVYSLGTYSDGRPFYAMRFIQGDSLQEALVAFHQAEKPGRDAGERTLALRDLLGRFVDVCNALAYAHSRGVLHRDLKPGNIMLGKYGETLVVDWGLAKPLGLSEPSTSESPLQPVAAQDAEPTHMGSVIGTPAYMSPEQAAGRLELVGPASDVYSLGATLYHLLTGRPPFKGSDRDALLHQVQQGSLPRPRHVQPNVPVALEAICLKAMAREPENRYSTMRALADDMEHWLADEPVSAYREPFLAQLRRWGRRHRPLVASAAVLLITATAALGIGLVMVNHEKNRTVAALAAEQEAKETAEAKEQETQAVLDFVENRVFAAARPKDQEGGLRFDVKLVDAVRAALPFVESGFKDQPLIEARLRMTIGRSFLHLGKPEIALEQYQAARALYAEFLGPDHANTLKSMNDLANSYRALGRYDEAVKLHEETLALRKATLGRDDPQTLASMITLANSYHFLGRHADALKLREETFALTKTRLGPDHPDTLGSMNNLAMSYHVLGRYAEAFKLHETTLLLNKAKLGPDHPHTLTSMSNLAESYLSLGRYSEALMLHKETLALRKANLGPDHPDTLESMNNLAGSYQALGQFAKAVKLHEETLALRKAKLGSDHPATLGSMNNLAASYFGLRRYSDALKLHGETLALFKAKLGPDHPSTLTSMGNLAECLFPLQREKEAMDIIDEFLQRATGKKVAPEVWTQVLDLRLRYFQRTQDQAACRQTADLWEALKRTDADSFYRAACFRSVTATVIRALDQAPAGGKEADAQANQAMAWLQKAVAAGYKDVANMKKDKDLDALRERADFKKLLADLEAKANPMAK